MQRILLFDWTVGGHHAVYARRWCEALAGRFRVLAAVPPATAESLTGVPAEVVLLREPRPALDPARAARAQQTEHADRELDLLYEAARRTRPAHIVHLYSDPVLRRLVRRPPLPAPSTICIFFARAHYPSAFGSRLTASERVRAAYQERLVARWRARVDAHSVLALDPAAVARWNRSHGAPVVWLPEPPVEDDGALRSGIRRRGAVAYGVLSRHKGIERLAAALEHARGVPVVIAGPVAPEFQSEFAEIRRRLCTLAPPADLRLREHDEADGLRLLQASRCAVLPYTRHFTASRVLLEAAVAGTPVIAHDFGLLGHLVRTHALGAVLDTSVPAQLASALEEFTRDEKRCDAHAEHLARFAALFSRERFRQHLLAVWSDTAGPAARAPITASTGSRP